MEDSYIFLSFFYPLWEEIALPPVSNLENWTHILQYIQGLRGLTDL